MNQQTQSIPPYPVEKGDELSLIELWKILVKYKFLIIAFTTLATLGGIYYASTLPTIYKAEVLMVPVKGAVSSVEMGGIASLVGMSVDSGAGIDGEQAFARLTTRKFLVNHIRERNLKPILFFKQWNKEEKRWIDKEPSDRGAAGLLKGMISAASTPKSKANLSSVVITWKDPEDLQSIANIANDLVSSINNHAKKRAIREAKKSIEFLEAELKKTNILDSRKLLYNLVEQQFTKIMIANIQDEFVFTVIDPAVAPTHPERSIKIISIIFSTALGLFFASFFAFGVNFLKINRKKV